MFNQWYMGDGLSFSETSDLPLANVFFMVLAGSS